MAWSYKNYYQFTIQTQYFSKNFSSIDELTKYLGVDTFLSKSLRKGDRAVYLDNTEIFSEKELAIELTKYTQDKWELAYLGDNLWMEITIVEN